jgi:N-acetylmuramoyl-L-alanine amidase
MTYDQNDIESMALCVWKEARGEGDQGMQAVAWVIRNRANDWYRGSGGSPVHTVVYAKNQFTSMSVPDDPEFDLQPYPDDQEYAYCLSVCPAILSGQDTDITNGAHYYANLAEVTSGWFTSNISGMDGKGVPAHPLLATVGKQSFYR